MSSTLTDVLNALYASEINVSIASFWDGGWLVRLGDEMNGFVAERDFLDEEFDQIPAWLAAEARRLHPESVFAKAYDAATAET